MAWFAVYEVATGTLHSAGTVVADTLPPGWAKKEFAQAPEGFSWNPATLEYDIAIIIRYRISGYDFMLRLTRAERIGLRNIAKTDDNVEDFLDMMRYVDRVYPDDDMIKTALTYLVNQGHMPLTRAQEIWNAS